jgi:DNA gyrase subunit A
MTEDRIETTTDTIGLAEDLTRAYMNYARATIEDRALPDVRDGLKPVQRRILYAMHELRLRSDQPHRKCARIVGEVLGKFHPHGDQAVYAALVRLGQDWVMRVPLVDGQGNWGSIDGDNPAQMRYTEARLTAAAEKALEHLDMDTVSWVDNFDNTLQEPTVLPGMLPNLLVNGATGIAVGMSTNIPPHNLGEVCDAVVFLALNWRRKKRVGVDELMKHIPGPDFPTGGIVYRFREAGEGGDAVDAIRQAYETGRSRMVMQARLEIEQIAGGKANIVVTALPYAVQKTTVMERLAKEVRRGRISGVTDLRDESDHTGMRLVVEVSMRADPQEVLGQVLKYTQLRGTFGMINLALIPDGNGGTRPEYLPLKDMLTHFIAHRLDVIERRSRYELEKKRARLHIVEGLLKALDVLDEVIDTIRRSRNVDTARSNLMRKFKFTEVQAQAILDMQLRRLTALERSKLADEAKELRARIRYLEKLLASEKLRLGVVIKETQALKNDFATPRRTVIVEAEGTGAGTVTTAADLVLPGGPQVLVVKPDGVQRHASEDFSYRGSRTLTKGAVRDVHLAHVEVPPDAEVLLLSSAGRGWKGAVGFVPEQGSESALGLQRGERVVAIAVLQEGAFLLLGTKQGRVKRAQVGDLSLLDRQWGPVIGLAERDELLFGDVAGEGAHVLFFTAEGQVLRIDGDTINPQQTDKARGVAGISLKKGDSLLGGAVVPNAVRDEEKWSVAVVTKPGYAHRAPLAEFSVKGRGTQGVRAWRPSKRGGRVGAIAVGRKGTVDVYLSDGRRQRLEMKDIPKTARDALGNRLIQAKDEPVARVIVLER